MSWLCFCPLLSSGPPHFLLLELVLMALRSSSSTWGILFWMTCFYSSQEPLCSSHFQTFLLQAPCIYHFWRRNLVQIHTPILTMAHYHICNTCCRFWYSPCLSLSDTYFFPLLLPAQMMISCTSCGCWGFLSTSLNLGLPEDTSLSLFCCKNCHVFCFVTSFVFFDVVIC